MTNWFGYDTAAERYAKGRPYFHPAVIRRVRQVLDLSRPLESALDVGCGTGLSALALRDVARRVVGIDPSAAMIARGTRDAAVAYAVAAGERLPFRAASFDLVAVSQAFHWMDRADFLAAARRALRPGGWLVVYDSHLTRQPPPSEAFHAWFTGAYVQRYPSPPRAALSFDDHDELAAAGFRLRTREMLASTAELAPDGLVDYLTSQTNVIAAVEGGREDIRHARAWLAEQTRPFFADDAPAPFRFAGPVWMLRRMD